MTPPIKIRDTVALLIAIALAAIALIQSFALDLHVPAARMLAAECQGFEALVSTGGTRLTCDAAAETGGSVTPVADGSAAPELRAAVSPRPDLT